MPKIKIVADDLRKFGGLKSLMDELKITAPSNYDIELTGNFTVDCMESLISYLKEKNSIFKSLTFSPDINYIPGVYGYAPAKTLFIPEGVYEINEFSICSCLIEKLFISSTVQKINTKAFFNSQFKMIEISKQNAFYSMDRENLVNTLTEEIVASEISISGSELIRKINSPENIQLWNNMKTAYNFTLEGPGFWKKNYEEKKNQLKKSDLPKQFTNKLEALKHCLSKNPDALENLFYLPCGIIYNNRFFGDANDLFNIIKCLTGESGAIHGKQFNESVLLYSTQLMHPGVEPFFFFLDENGIELFAPQINLYLFFPEEEIELIPAYLDYLKINFIALTKAYIMNHENLNTLTDKDEISTDDRNNLTKKLKLNGNNDKLIEQYVHQIKHLANSYNLDVTVSTSSTSISISSSEEINGFSFSESLEIDDLLNNAETEISRLEEAFRQLHIAVSCVMGETNVC